MSSLVNHNIRNVIERMLATAITRSFFFFFFRSLILRSTSWRLIVCRKRNRRSYVLIVNTWNTYASEMLLHLTGRKWLFLMWPMNCQNIFKMPILFVTPLDPPTYDVIYFCLWQFFKISSLSFGYYVSHNPLTFCNKQINDKLSHSSFLSCLFCNYFGLFFV